MGLARLEMRWEMMALSKSDRMRPLKVAVLLTFVAAALAAIYAPGGALPPVEAAGEPAANKFQHSTHSQIKCDQCHVRRADAIKPAVPGHRACISCHVKEFTSTTFGICSNCHSGITAVRPPVEPFPPRQTFGLEFSHKTHATYIGGERRADCAECHAIAGATGTFPGHKECYVCHKAPDQVKAGEKAAAGSCGVCHTVAGSRARFAAGGATYRTTKFSHSEHISRGVGCAECHGVVGDGAGVQVSQPALREHVGTGFGKSCGSCHNGRRAFSGDRPDTCYRCHRNKV
jgi:c(7)-type cytochrome triheme protein